MPQGVDFNNMSQDEQRRLETYRAMIESDIAEDKGIANILEDMGKVLRTSKYIIEVKDNKVCVIRDKLVDQILDKLTIQVEYQVQKIIGSYL